MTSYNAIVTGEIDADSPITADLMSKLRDNPKAIAEADASVPDDLLPTVLLGSATPSGTSTVNFSGLDLTPYKYLKVVLQGVSGTTTGTFTVGTSLVTISTVSPSNTLFAMGDIELASGLGFLNSYSASTSGTIVAATGVTNASTSIAITCDGGNYDAGSIRVYGCK